MENEIKYETIDAEDIPKRERRPFSIWDELFASIKKGKAIVIPQSEAKPEAVTSALRNRHKKNKLQHLCACVRTNESKKRFAYVAYPNDNVDD